jgi:hypothetical protein
LSNRAWQAPAIGTAGRDPAALDVQGNGRADEMQAGNEGAAETRDEANAIFAIDYLAGNTADPNRMLSFCFLRLANLDNGAFKRLNRYETALWRQAVQTIFVLRRIGYR